MSTAAHDPTAPAAAAHEAYVYYRIDAAAEAAWRGRLLGLQQALRERHAGLRTGLLRRTEAAGAEVTLMETYACDRSSGAASRLDELLLELETACAALPGRPPSPRHLEVFERCA